MTNPKNIFLITLPFLLFAMVFSAPSEAGCDKNLLEKYYSDENVFPGTNGRRDFEEVLLVIDCNSHRVFEVFNNYYSKDPEFEGEVVFDFTIAPSGRITNLKIRKSTVSAKAFERELFQVIEKLNYANRPVEPFQFSFPIQFKRKTEMNVNSAIRKEQIVHEFEETIRVDSNVSFDSDLFRRLEGEWALDPKCTNRKHRIIFSNDRSRMNLIYEKPFEDSRGKKISEANYRVISSDEYRITAKLDDEYRLDAYGNVVTWQIVMIDNPTYRWRRVDWVPGESSPDRYRCPG